MQQHIALSHANGIAAEAILEKLQTSGIAPEGLILLDDQSRAGNRLPYAGGNLPVQDQMTFDYSECALLLMPQAEPELAQRAVSQGCLVISHELDTKLAPLFLDGAREDPDIAFNATSLRLPGPELSCLLPALLALERACSIEQVNIVLLRSAEFHGKAGVDELASQTVSLLNARAFEPSIFEQQFAFNLIPQAADSVSYTDLSQVLGNSSYSASLQFINVPVFHGFAAAVQLRFASEVAAGDGSDILTALDQVQVKNTPATPISDCNQLFSCVISQLEQAPNQPSCLQFWMIADPMRYGLANNYVNVAEFLLKSFL